MADGNSEKWKRISELEQNADVLRNLDLYFRRLLVDDTNLIKTSLKSLLEPLKIISLQDYEEHLRHINEEFKGIYSLIHEALSKKSWIMMEKEIICLSEI